MKVLHSRKVLKLPIVVLALLATSVAVYAAKIDLERYQSNPGDSFAVTDASGGGCKKVTNNSSNSYFIPTKTAAEYDAFKNAAPRLGVSLSECAINLVNNAHTDLQCVAAGGTVVDDGAGNKMCKYAQASCPSGWTQYGNWSTTGTGVSIEYKNGVCLHYVPDARCGTQVATCVPPLTHSWSNTATEENTCRGTVKQVTYVATSQGHSYSCSTNGTKFQTCGGTSATVLSLRTEIGCY